VDPRPHIVAKLSKEVSMSRQNCWRGNPQPSNRTWISFRQDLKRTFAGGSKSFAETQTSVLVFAFIQELLPR
jgi:hypothetical protein